MVRLQAEARHREVGCSSEREGEGLLKQTQKKVGVFNSSLPPLLETMSEPNIAYWNYCKEMNC